MVLAKAWQEYSSNFKIALSFALLGIFVFFFVLFPNAFVSSGSVFFEYSLLKSGLASSLFEIVAALVYLLFFSVFLSVMIFAVRHDMNEVRMQHYLLEKLPRFVFKNFVFLSLYALLAVALAAVLILLGFPDFAVAIALLIISMVFMFVPQSIVVDEERIRNAVLNAVHFVFTNKRLSVFTILVSTILLAIVPLIEIFFDRFDFAGRFVSLVIVLLFVLPFVEVLKTVVFMTKFGLIKTQL